MPVQVAHETDLLRIVLSGEVSALELRSMADEVLGLEADLPTTPSRLADLSALEGGEINFQLLHDLADRRKAGPPKNAIRTAIVASSPLGFGFARMFQALTDHPLVTVRIFPSVPAAEAWLRENS